jgi:endo-1,4-beta-D-glucanase Y
MDETLCSKTAPPPTIETYRRSRRAICRSAIAALGVASLSRLNLRSAAAQDDYEPRRPFPQRLTYAKGTIRPTSRAQEEQEADVRAAYDAWKTHYLVSVTAVDGGELYRIAFGLPGAENYEVTVSEGQGFGMMIVSLMAGHDPDARAIFDGLWRFHRANPSEIDPRLMTWRIPASSGSDSAFDGDADAAYALLLAEAQWGNQGGIDYGAAARELIAAILESTIGPQSLLPLLGDWVEPEGDPYSQWTVRPSDFMLGHFRAFGRTTGDTDWAKVVAACQRVTTELQRDYSPETGLLPDFAVLGTPTDRRARPAEPNFLESENDGAYAFNAGRTPWRLGADALINGDETRLAQVRRISTWIESAAGGDPLRINAGYTLAGQPLPDHDYFTTFFAAPFAVAAMVDPDQQAWLDALYEAIRGRVENYYEDSVALLCLLILTGSFWDPTVG